MQANQRFLRVLPHPPPPIPLYMFYDIYIFMASFRTPAEQPGLSNNNNKKSTNAPQ